MADVKCAYCGAIGRKMHRDHVVPRSRGGPDSPSNIVMVCEDCNLSKGPRLPSEWMRSVPQIVAAIERRISDRVVVSFGRRRYPVTARPKPEPLVCTPCDEVIEGPPTGEWAGRHWGMLRWWEDAATKIVARCEVWCPACMWTSARKDLVDHRHDGRLLRDIPIEWCAGSRAAKEIGRIATTYLWDTRAIPFSQLMTFGLALAALPTCTSAFLSEEAAE